MRREAEAHADEDKKRKELIEARNYADNVVYTSEKTLRELGDKVPAELKSQVESQIQVVKDLMNKDDTDAMRKATEELGQTLQKIGSAAYQQAGPAAGGPGDAPGGGEPGEGGPGQQQPGGGPSGGTSGDDVVDGEFRNAG